MNAISNLVPSLHNAFNAQDPNRRYLVDNTSSPLNDPGIVIYGAASNIGSGVEYSGKGWNTRYSANIDYSPREYIDYVKARKEYISINNPGAVTAGKVNLLTASLNLSGSSGETTANNMLSNAPLVLLVQGDVIIQNFPATRFNPSVRSFMIIADGTITFGSSMSEVNGIFFANKVNFSDVQTTNPLLIQGNIVSQQDVPPVETRRRARLDFTRPSIFIVFNPSMYIDLLQDVAVSDYQWHQLQ